MDLPVAHQFALKQEKELETDAEPTAPALNNPDDTDDEAAVKIKTDPVGYLAAAAGFDDGEKWWEQMFEYRQNNEQVFEAVTEAMQVLRQEFPEKEDRREQLREA